MGTRTILIALLMASVAAQANAQGRERSIVVGIRSGLIAGSMTLSDVDPDFDDLANDGPKGPHMSGFFLLVAVRSHLRVGVETLVANSDKDARTTMNYQAAGPVAEFTFGDTWFASAGAHAGGVIVNAMARVGNAPASGATSGSYFKGNGAFVAPYLDVGYRFRRSEVGGYVKRVGTLGEEGRGGLSGFSATFVGVRVAVRM